VLLFLFLLSLNNLSPKLESASRPRRDRPPGTRLIAQHFPPPLSPFTRPRHKQKTHPSFGH
jgi:hypothetical protein